MQRFGRVGKRLLPTSNEIAMAGLKITEEESVPIEMVGELISRFYAVQQHDGEVLPVEVSHPAPRSWWTSAGEQTTGGWGPEAPHSRLPNSMAATAACRPWPRSMERFLLADHGRRRRAGPRETWPRR